MVFLNTQLDCPAQRDLLANRIVMTPSSPFRKNALDGFWFAIGVAFGMFVWDTGKLIDETYVLGIGRAQCAVLHTAIALNVGLMLIPAMVFGLLYAFAMGEQTLPDWIRTTAHSYRNVLRYRPLRRGTSAELIRELCMTHSRWVAAPIALAVFAVVCVKLLTGIIEDVAVPKNGASASLLVIAAIATFSILLFLVLRGISTAILKRIALHPWVRGVVARPWITALMVALLCIAALFTVVFLMREKIRVLNLTMLWASLVAVAGGIITVVVLGRIRLRPRWIRRIARSTFAVIAAVLLVLTTVWFSFNGGDRAMLIKSTTWASLSITKATAFFDTDGDGYTQYFGDNDCAPHDPLINPGAIDIPNNNIDEDCSGEDLKYDEFAWENHWDLPLPASFPAKPHIILLTVDALNPNHLSYNGYHRPTSRNIDAFAAKSVQFTNAYAQGPSTRLSIPALFTSKYDPQIHRSTVGRFPFEILPENVTIAEILRDSGYQTMMVAPTSYFTKWRGISQGFEVVDDTPAKSNERFTSELVTQAGLRLLQDAKASSKPVFLWLHYYDPHSPYNQPPGVTKFGKLDVDVYDAEIQYTDKFIGKLLDELDALVPRERRVVIVSADHGESFDNVHPVHRHGFDLHSNVLRVPLFVQAPGAKPRVETGAATLLDITPTLVNLTANRRSFSFEGMSLVPSLFGQPIDPERNTFHTFYLPENIGRKREPLQMVSVRNHKYNFINDRNTNVYALYNFTADPMEQNNLFESHREVATKMRDLIQLWLYHMSHYDKKRLE